MAQTGQLIAALAASNNPSQTRMTLKLHLLILISCNN